ncbi:laminin subunit alpha-4-like [Clytia hemisphaerica]
MKAPACSITLKNSFGFSFQTYAKDGVMLVADGPTETELVIEIRNKQVNVELQQANIRAELQSQISGGLSDGEWHSLTLVIEDGKRISLYLGTDAGLVKSSKPLPKAEVTLEGDMFFGGLEDQEVGFNGNIRQLYMCGSELNMIGDPIGENVFNDAKIGSNTLKAPIELIPPPPPPTIPPTKPPTSPTQPPTTVMTTTTTTAPTTTTSTTTMTTSTTTTTPTTTTTSTTTTTTPTTTTTTTTLAPTTTSTSTTTTTTTTTTPTTTNAPSTTAVQPTTTPSLTEPPTDPPTTSDSDAGWIEETTTSPPQNTTTLSPAPKCSSKLKPLENAYGFGMQDESYIAFDVSSKKLGLEAQYEFSFYTMEEEGLLMSINMKSKYDYEAIYLSGGKVHYIFNAGSGSLTLSSKTKVNDGKWHKLVARRNRRNGILSFDDVLMMAGESPPSSAAVNNIKTLYFGGVPENAMVPAKIPSLAQSPMKGGMRDFKLFGESLGNPIEEIGISDAYDELPYKSAIHFGTNGGYVQKFKQLKVGQDFRISFDVRSRNPSGTLFYVVGKEDFLKITIENIQDDGSIKVTCNNGGGLFSVAYKPEPSVCNGDIYSVLVEKKMKTLKLTVNGAVTEETTTKSSTSADTNSPAYFGGLPVDFQPSDYKPFEGCISKVEINGDPVDFTSDVIKDGAVMAGCPE